MKKCYTQKYNYLLAGLVISAVFSSGTAFAGYSTASTIEHGTAGPPASPTGFPSVTYGSYSDQAVITAILSSPQTVGTRTYTVWSFLANDGTGSIDIFATKTAIAAIPGFTPTVGDGISISGTYSPFDQIPEIETITPATLAATVLSTGNAIPAPTLVTIPGLQAQLPTLNFQTAGYFVQLNNVLITPGNGTVVNVGGAVTFPTPATETADGSSSETYTVTDSGLHSMELFDQVTSYSTDGLMGGNTVPTGLVDIDGFVDVFGTGTAALVEMVPMEITSVVPEPSVLSLCGEGAGAAMALFYFVRRKAKA
jgi:hypothetical protein